MSNDNYPYSNYATPPYPLPHIWRSTEIQYIHAHMYVMRKKPTQPCQWCAGVERLDSQLKYTFVLSKNVQDIICGSSTKWWDGMGKKLCLSNRCGAADSKPPTDQLTRSRSHWSGPRLISQSGAGMPSGERWAGHWSMLQLNTLHFSEVNKNPRWHKRPLIFI